MNRTGWGAGSVRRRLTLGNVAILALVLALLGLAFRQIVQANLVAALDRSMETRGERAVRRWEGLDEVERAALLQKARLQPDRRGRRALWPELFPGANPNLPAESDPGDTGPDEAPKVAALRPKILDLQGRDYLSQTPDTPWDEAAFARSMQGEERMGTVRIRRGQIRVFSLPLRENGRIVAVVQIARPLGGVRYEVWTITRSLLMLIPLALLAAGLSGAFLTVEAIRPVRTLRLAASKIGAKNLSERLPVSGGDEFAELAAAFNQTLNRVEAAYEQQRRFTSDASHELRTPLTVIRGNASLALARERAAPEYRQALERVSRVAETMSQTIEDLLLLARADAGQFQIDLTPTRLADVLETVRESASGPNTPPITLNLTESELRVLGNFGQLTRLFANLVGNAVRHTPPDGRIMLGAEAKEATIVVTVQDTGEGIAPDHLPHVRERFYRADAARAQETGGTGLGLAISQSIIEAHHGTLEIESVLGLGTVVRVTLPRASAD
jgi:signal transduction histidine kinase